MGLALVGGAPGACVPLSTCAHAYGLQCVHACMTCVTWGSAHGQGRPSTLTAGRCHFQGPRLDPELDPGTRQFTQRALPWGMLARSQAVPMTGPPGIPSHSGCGLALQPELMGSGLPAGGVRAQHGALREGHMPVCIHKDDRVGPERAQGPCSVPKGADQRWEGPHWAPAWLQSQRSQAQCLWASGRGGGGGTLSWGPHRFLPSGTTHPQIGRAHV